MTPFFQQGSFVNDGTLTPEQIKAKRQLIASMMPQYGKARYVGEGLGQLAYGIGAGRSQRKLDAAESAGNKEASDLFSGIFSGGRAQPGGFTVLGQSQPTASAAPPVAVDPSNPEAIASAAMNSIGKGSTPDGIRAGLVARGLPEHIAEGFVRNIGDESGFNPGINEASPLVPGSRGGFGLNQWTGPRRRSLEAFAAQKGMPASDAGVQMDFLVSELQGPESAAWSDISGTSNPNDAAAAIVNSYLRPSEPNRAAREAKYLGGGQPQAPANAAPGPSEQQLIEVLTHPFASPEQKAVAQQMLGQRQQQNDPSFALGLEKQQLELEALRNPQSKGVVVNGRIVDPSTGQVIYQPAPGEAGSTEFGLTPQYGVDANGNPAIIQIGKDGTATQTKLPEGITFQKEPIKVDAGTQWILLDPISRQPVGSIPKDLRGAASEAAIGRAQGEATGDAIAGLSGVVQQANDAVSLIDSITSDPALPGITGIVQGRLPPLSQGGTDLGVKIKQLQGKAFLQAFETLKGGGQITEREGQAATDAMARLNRAQSTEAYIAALNELKTIMQTGADRARAAAGQPTGQAVAPPQQQRLRYNPQTGELE